MKDDACEQGRDQIDGAKDVDIDVIADNKAGGGISWSLDIKTSGHGNNNKVDLPAGENYKLRFDLKDHTNLKLRFDASGPIFAREGSPAPPCPTALTTKQIMVYSCDDKKLVLIDWNYGTATEIVYQLNFVDRKGLHPYCYDPEIKNGGGGVRPLL